MGGQSFASGARANMDAYQNMANLNPQMGPLMGFKPEVNGSQGMNFDIKGPLAQMAFGMMQREINPAPRPFNPLQPVPVYGVRQNPLQMGRLYGNY